VHDTNTIMGEDSFRTRLSLFNVTLYLPHTAHFLAQCFSVAGPRPGNGPLHQLYRAARDSPGIDN